MQPRSLQTNDILGAQPKLYGKSKAQLYQQYNSGAKDNILIQQQQQLPQQQVIPNQQEQQIQNQVKLTPVVSNTRFLRNPLNYADYSYQNYGIKQPISNSQSQQQLSQKQLQLQPQQEVIKQQQQIQNQPKMQSLASQMPDSIDQLVQQVDQKQRTSQYNTSQQLPQSNSIQQQQYQQFRLEEIQQKEPNQKKTLEQNLEQFYKGMTPNINSRQQYASYNKILNAHDRMKQNNPQIQQSTNAYEQDSKYLQNESRFYGEDEQNTYEQQLAQQKDQNVLPQEIIQLENKEEEKVNIQSEKQEVQYNNQIQEQQQQLQKQQQQKQQQSDKQIIYVIITDSDSKTNDQVSKLLFNNKPIEFHEINIPGGSIGLMNESTFGESNRNNLLAQIQFLSKFYSIKEIQVYNNLFSKNVLQILSNNDISRLQLRDINIDQMKKLQLFLNSNGYQDFYLRGYCLDQRGSPEEIY